MTGARSWPEPLTADEQRSIFPRLTGYSDSAPVVCTGELVARLIATIEALTAELANERMFGSDQSDNGPWGQIVRLVTAQPDWDEELADGPDDIVTYLRNAVNKGPTVQIVQALLESETEIDVLRTVVQRFLDGWTRGEQHHYWVRGPEAEPMTVGQIRVLAHLGVAS